VALQVHPHAPACRDQQALALASLLDAVAFLGQDPQTGRDLIQLARLQLTEPLGSRHVLNRSADAVVEPVGDALG
jgi:hypothetical protein